MIALDIVEIVHAANVTLAPWQFWYHGLGTARLFLRAERHAPYECKNIGVDLWDLYAAESDTSKMVNAVRQALESACNPT